MKPVSEGGRGWDRLGYSDMICRDGTIVNLTPYNDDDIVQSHEKTWGAAGVNSISRHVVLEGGRNDDNVSKMDKWYNLYTSEQIVSLELYVRRFKELHPGDRVIGHNEVSYKTCPNFDVQAFLNSRKGDK